MYVCVKSGIYGLVILIFFIQNGWLLYIFSFFYLVTGKKGEIFLFREEDKIKFFWGGEKEFIDLESSVPFLSA